jgi:hypothetical protein
MATSKAQPRYTVTVIEAGSAQLFSQATACHLGEAGTLAWSLAGRAYLHGYEQPEVRLYHGDEQRLAIRPSREICGNRFKSGLKFWNEEIQA